MGKQPCQQLQRQAERQLIAVRMKVIRIRERRTIVFGKFQRRLENDLRVRPLRHPYAEYPDERCGSPKPHDRRAHADAAQLLHQFVKQHIRRQRTDRQRHVRQDRLPDERHPLAHPIGISFVQRCHPKRADRQQPDQRQKENPRRRRAESGSLSPRIAWFIHVFAPLSFPVCRPPADTIPAPPSARAAPHIHRHTVISPQTACDTSSRPAR